MAKPGFLLIELMVAIFIGLVLISALMHMQSILLELQDSFFMRDKALVVAINWLEHDTLHKPNVSELNASNSGLSVPDSSGPDESGRNFELEFGQPDKNRHALTVKVKWRSLVGKNCCLEL